MKGKIFAIEEFSVFDGDGIRTTVFLKGCPLKCSWCHNPEGQSFETEYIRSIAGCLKCGRCEELSTTKGQKRLLTLASKKACPKNLIRVCGEDYSPKELADKILKNADFLNESGGGVTFSGGEPLAQADFLLETLKLLENKINRAIQTSGYCKEEIFKDVLKNSDYFLYDLKVFNSEKHVRYCGVDNQVIKSNYITLAKSDKKFITRVPLIPTVTDTKENIESIAKFMAQNNVKKVEVLPYNKLAGSKYSSLLREYKPDFNDTIESNKVNDIFLEYNIECKEI